MFHQYVTVRETTSSRNSSIRISLVPRLLGIAALLTGLLGASIQHARASAPFVVNVTGDAHDATIGDGLCDTGGGVCTLRAAIEEANADPGSDTIDFNLPGGGVHVMGISLDNLPQITDPLILDGTSNPSCAVPCIVLSGANLGAFSINGLQLNTHDSTVKGFIITSWSNYSGIEVLGNSNTIQSNDIGFWPGNPTPLPNGDGIRLFGSNNLIGGTTPAQRNVISGNGEYGIQVSNGCCATVSSNVISGNFIGTSPLGNDALGNGQSGILATSGADHSSILNNVISGNLGCGIDLAGDDLDPGASNTLVRGNKIGTNAAGRGAVGNGFCGILISYRAINNSIGGTASGQGNIIAYNGGSGVSVQNSATMSNRITHNSIFSNTGLGIDLGPAGVTPNDTLDADSGPNQLQNFPGLTSAASGTFRINGRLNSTPSQTFTIEFFASPAGSCDPSHFGEGKTYLGSQNVVTNAAGNANFSFRSPVGIRAGQSITATATDSAGNTSEFSRCRPVS